MSTVTDYLRRMENDITATNMWTKEQAEVWSSAYWQIRWDESLNTEEKKAKIAAHQDSFRPVRDVHVNQQGNTVVHRNNPESRYVFDFDKDFRSDGWLQFDTDQDAWYYGVWVNSKTFRTLTYAEGDIYFTVCLDAEHFNAELKSICEFHGEGFQFIACDTEAATSLLLGGGAKGKAEIHRQDRNKFFVNA